MAADNVYDENQEYLIEARNTISELEDLKDKLEEIKLLQKKINGQLSEKNGQRKMKSVRH